MLSLITLFFLTGPAHAQTAAPASTAKKVNTQLYEQEAEQDKGKSFTSKVRVVRDISDDIEVFFESKDASGAYTLPRSNKDYATMLNALEKSKKPGGPTVTVTTDSDKRIKSVVEGSKSGSGSGNPYDPGKIPD